MQGIIVVQCSDSQICSRAKESGHSRCCQTSPAIPSVLRAASLNFFPTMPNISFRLSVAPAAIHPQNPADDQATHKQPKPTARIGTACLSSAKQDTTGRVAHSWRAGWATGRRPRRGWRRPAARRAAAAAPSPPGTAAGTPRAPPALTPRARARWRRAWDPSAIGDRCRKRKVEEEETARLGRAGVGLGRSASLLRCGEGVDC